MIVPVRAADVCFTATGWNLASIKRYHQLIESNLPTIVESQNMPDWIGESGVSGKAGITHLHFQWLNGMLPNVLRWPLILSTWAIFESTLIGVAETFREKLPISYGLFDRKADVPLPASHLWSDGIITRAKYYYQHELGIEVFPNAQFELEVRSLYKLRNALAHAGGQRMGMKPRDWAALLQWSRQHPGLDLTNGYIAVGEAFVTYQLELVHSISIHVVEQAREIIHDRGLKV